jgi:hypothetical protein
MQSINKFFERHSIWEIILPLIAIYAIRSFLQEDGGKVVSNRGAAILDDENLMQRVTAEIDESKSSKKHLDHITVTLD